MLASAGLDGVGVPTASTLLYSCFPADYPILDIARSSRSASSRAPSIR